MWIWEFAGSQLEDSAAILQDLVDSNFTLAKIANRHGTSQPTVTRRKQEFIAQGYLIENNGSRSLTDIGQKLIEERLRY